ncbi:hypothetical protein GF412_03125 [Candidatus Micrarchaeota archaeon]|nr:hypothetical protein [Candidatus Micrarchaeota archaeon]MBD3417945.1 hypothetical protein [Candidatus Micrarchaeota archaeon]
MGRKMQGSAPKKGKVFVLRQDVPRLLALRSMLSERREASRNRELKELNERAARALREENRDELVRLLKAGAGRGKADDAGNSLIEIAAWEGRKDMARILLQHDFMKEELFSRDQLVVAHFYACRAGKESVAELIKLYADEKL